MSVRVFWQMNPGRNVVNLNWDAVNADSVVVVSASEYNPNSQQLPDGSDQRFVGAADVTVANVTPHGPPFDSNHGVTFVVEVGWDAPLTICTDIAVISNAPDQVIYAGPQIESRPSVPGATPLMKHAVQGPSMVRAEQRLSATVPAMQAGTASKRQGYSGRAVATELVATLPHGIH